MTSPFLIITIGESTMQQNINSNEHTFLALFGICPLNIFQIWQLIVDKRNLVKFLLKSLMWVLLFFRSYNKEKLLSSMLGVSKTSRKRVWLVVQKVAAIESLIGQEFV